MNSCEVTVHAQKKKKKKKRKRRREETRNPNGTYIKAQLNPIKSSSTLMPKFKKKSNSKLKNEI